MVDKAKVAVVENAEAVLHDPEFNEFFNVEWATEEYSKHGGTWVAVTCVSCPAKWAMHLGEYNELDKGERAAVMSHAKEHERKGYRMRRLVR